MDNRTILDGENLLSKTQLRRKRYEDSTLNKPCTVRANPNMHDAIRSFAKSGECKTCQDAN